MATIILAKDGMALQEFPLSKERTTIGRRTYNDIVIDAPGISAEHAVIVTTLDESYFEDLESTNGSQINGQPVKKHFLQDQDLIELATHTIQYCMDECGAGAVTLPIFASAAKDELGDIRQITVPSQKGTATVRSTAIIKVLNGIGAGKEIALTKDLTTIGHPGVQVAVLTNGAQGYSLTHVEGDAYPIVNGVSIDMRTQPLANGDVIVLSGTEMMFLY